MLKNAHKTILWIILILLIVLATIFCSWRIFNKSLLKIDYENLDACRGNYKLINPEIACLYSSDENYLRKYEELESKLKEAVNYAIESGKATNVSIFVRDLVSRRWIGVNENENYAPASLLKLPLLIAYYKLSEIQPAILSQKYTYNGPGEFNNEMQHIRPENSLEAGKEYTIEELLYRMIVYSDNNAIEPLFKLINDNFINKVFIDLGIYIPTSSNLETNFLSPKIYAAILRALFNSIYLEPPTSEKILDLLVKTSFNGALVAGIPSEIKIAHKFGEREIKNQNNNIAVQSLYDCGIIYYPKDPYILCVMTKGSDFNNLEEIIKNISQITYREFSD